MCKKGGWSVSWGWMNYNDGTQMHMQKILA